MSLLTTTSGASGLLPADYGDLIIEPVQVASLALNPLVSTVVTTQAHVFHVPVVNVDAAASWVAEGAEITPSDPTISEIIVTPAKVAGLVVVSSELANDSSPAAQQVVGDGLGRSIAAQLDTAFLGSLSAPAPAGLGSLTNASVNRIVAGTSPTNLDAFAQAIALVEQDGAEITAFVANPTDALAVQTIKTGSGYATPLLGVDATNGTKRQVLGVPLLVSKYLPQGMIYGLAAGRITVVMRQDVEVIADASIFFTSDRIALRAVMRVGFAYPTPKSIARIALTAS